ncbi:hypothetical protein O3G_MSEX014891 [Manduca sexta]|uniref:Nanos-type domain-containing protein n=1 Tax=Manduca sexta TaxID=7130 RepID=A0A921ZV91_MANSE|nr:hypothetical protein O3G_MSEX014891 [Manduca sexta]
MYPTKAVMDYMSEMNRLFPRNEINDVYRPSHTLSPFTQTTPVKSSSSTESTPPDIYPEITPTPRDYDTPYIVRRQRPIIGRRLMTDTPTLDQTPKSPKSNDYNIWQYDETLQNYAEQRSRAFYELFPSEKKVFEFQTPVKNPDWNVSPNKLTVSPSSIPNLNLTPYSPSPCNISTPVYIPSTSKYPDRPKVCTFCRKNGETPLVYTTHTVKQMVGEKNIVSCPILRSHVCSTCGASGDDAHTITYCPVLRNSNNGCPLQSTTITLKNTRVKSNGKRRY